MNPSRGLRRAALRCVWAMGAFAVISLFGPGCGLVIESPSQTTTTTEDTSVTDTAETVTTTDAAEVTEEDTQPQGECGPSFCKNEGPCHAIAPKKVFAEDGSCTWDCGYPPEYVAAEGDEHCDLEDNDCDGVTDDVPPRASDTATCTKGVCAGAPSRCVAGAWACELGGVPTYESVERTCDKLDNDCDGETDEGVVGTGQDCDFVGVCAQVASVACVNGQWDCTPAGAAVPGFETDEATCDGLDNDCDGDTDEGIGSKPTDLAASTCKKVGQCAVGTKPSCSAGDWACDYSAVLAYEATETLCDGKDNDCDGQTDEDLTSLKPTNCDAATKAKASFGVCAQGAAAVCIGGTTSCTYDYLADYESVETSCDGKDNDCDGQTDEALSAPPAFCNLPGVCAQGATAFCDAVTKAWECDFAAVPAYESSEKSCDGKDNDCDGKVDEGIALPPSACTQSTEGVCKNQPITVTCSATGEPVCDLSAIAGYEKVETRCDGKDNDCDGFTDENIEDLASSTCKKLGVCASTTKVVAKCAAGAWTCDYSPLGSDYQEGAETKCDAKDNDCDGLIDEEITSVGVESCNKGVCAGSTTSVCVNGTFKCDVGGIVGYENPEASCDGKDNNCDGDTDEGVCGALAPCTAGAQCKSGRCRLTPDGAQSCCVSKDGECPEAECAALALVGQTGCLQYDNGAGLQWFTTTCNTNGWVSDPDADLCTNGACSDGICRECAPGTRVCDGATAVLPCNEAGEYGDPIACPPEDPAPTCAAGLPGTCLRHEDQAVRASVDPAGYDIRGATPIRTGVSSHFVVWQNLTAANLTPAAYLIGARSTDAFARIGASYWNLVAAGAGSVVTPRGVKVSDTATALVWQEVSASDAGNIRLRAFNHNTGNVLGSPVFANVTKPFEQSLPQVARAKDGAVVVVWQTTADAAGSGPDIALHSATFNGTAFTVAGTDKTVNNVTAGDQRQPAITALGDGNVAIAFTDSTLDAPTTLGVYARLYDPRVTGGGAFLGDAFALHANPQGDQHDVVLAERATGFVAVWTSNHQGDENVYARTFGNDGAPTSAETLLTKLLSGVPLTGDQGHADVTVTEDGSIVVVYDDTSGDVSGGSIQLLQLSDLLEANGAARRVNENQVVGTQRRPKVAPSLDGFGTPWVLVSFESENANGPALTGSYVRPMVLNAYKQ